MTSPTLPARQRISPVTWAALALVTIVLAGLVVHGWPYDLMPRDNEWGETMIALHAVDQYRAVGMKWGLIENFGTIEAPLLYTHNVNIGNIFYVLLDSAGVTTFAGKQLGTLVVFCIGLFFVHLCVAKYTASQWCGIVTLALFCLDYRNVLSFGYNALRAWHWFALFGLLYAVRLWQEGDRPRLARCLLVITAFAAFGCGYDFYLICGLAAFISVLLIGSPSRRRWVQAVLLGVVLALPIIARQFQVAAVMGLDYWWQDIRFSLAIKLPFGADLFSLPPLEEVDAYYRAHHVLRPPAHPQLRLAEIWRTLGQMTEIVTIPSWGFLTVALHLVMVAAALLTLAGSIFVQRLRRLLPSAALIVSLAVGAYLGLFFLAPFSFHVYLKHQYPLLAAPLLVPKGIAIVGIAVAIARLRTDVVRMWPARPGVVRAAWLSFAAIGLGILVDVAIVHVRGHQRAHYMDLDWVAFARRQDPAELAVTLHYFPPRIPPAYEGLEKARQYDATAIQTLLDHETGRVRPHAPAFEDRLPAGVRYLIYQPTDRWCHFDAESQDTYQEDYLYLALRALLGTDRRCPVGNSLFFPEDCWGKELCWVAPGTSITMDVYFARRPVGIRDARLVVRPYRQEVPAPKPGDVVRADEPAVGMTVFSTAHRRARTWYESDESQDGQTLEMDIQGIYEDKVVHLKRFIVEVSKSHDFIPNTHVPPARRQPSVDELIALYPEVPVIERGTRGIGYVVFDLGALRAARAQAAQAR